MPHIPFAAPRSLLIAAAAALAIVSEAHAQPSGRVAYLIDYATRTLDLVDLEHDTVALGLEPVGDVPNQIRVRDRTAYVVNSSPEELQIIDLAGPTTTGTVALGAGTNPWAVALAGDRAYVSLWGGDQVAVVDLVALSVIDVIEVGVSPEGLCLAGDELYVANSGFVQFGVYDPGTVSVIDTATQLVTHTIPVGMNPQWCAVDGEGEVHVVCSDLFGTDNGRVFVLDPAAHAPLDSLRVGGFPGPIAISGGGIGWMVEYGAGLLSIDTVSHTVLHDIDDPVSAGGIGALGLGLDAIGRVHVALSADQLLTVLAPEGTLESSYAVGPGPLDVAIFEDEVVPVVLTGFSAVRQQAAVELTWTIAGNDLVGCHVARRASEDEGGEFVSLTSRPIESDGGRYTFVDLNAGPGALVYRLTGVGARDDAVPLGLFPVAADGLPGAAPASRLAIAARPNPAAAAAGDEILIELAIPGREMAVEVVVFDALGRAIRLLHRGPLTASTARLRWDGRDSSGRPAPPGAYFVRVIGEREARSAKLILLH